MQSLEVPTLDYPDNAKVIELLEKRPTGIFPALDLVRVRVSSPSPSP